MIRKKKGGPGQGPTSGKDQIEQQQPKASESPGPGLLVVDAGDHWYKKSLADLVLAAYTINDAVAATHIRIHLTGDGRLLLEPREEH